MTWQRKLDKKALHPGLLEVMERVLTSLSNDGIPFKVYSGLRTFEQQDELYAQGRTTGTAGSGAIVTKAKGGQSMHNYGLAVDLAPDNLATTASDVWWPDPDKRDGKVWFRLEEALADAAQDHDEEEGDDGLDYEWGGRWKFRDVPHCQVRTTLKELNAGHYPYCSDVEWLVKAHTTFLYGTPWMTLRTQFLLGMRSYDVGPVDGDFGPRSRGAMETFQLDHGLPVTSSVTARTVEELVRVHQLAASTVRGTSSTDA
jgi:peptidoglycan L-alanyl-D-glutamate endopeptidase CwlK